MIRLPCPRIAPPCLFVIESPLYHVAVLELAEHLTEHLAGRTASSAMLMALTSPYTEAPYWGRAVDCPLCGWPESDHENEDESCPPRRLS